MKPTWTWQAFLEGACTHQQFYGQFFGEELLTDIPIFAADLFKACVDSKDHVLFKDVNLSKFDKHSTLCHQLTYRDLMDKAYGVHIEWTLSMNLIILRCAIRKLLSVK